MLGGTAGRTTLNGEGLQHQDGHSLLIAMAFPTVRAYDPAYAYEIAVIVPRRPASGCTRTTRRRSTTSRSTTKTTMMPAMPAGCEEGIIRGMYKLSSNDAEGGEAPRAAVRQRPDSSRSRCARQRSSAEQYDVSSDVWSVTSYNEPARDAQECERWNMLNPEKPRATRTCEEQLRRDRRAVHRRQRLHADPGRADSVRGCNGGLFALGTDGMGRSESRDEPASPLRGRRRVDRRRHALHSSARRQVRPAERRRKRSKIWASTREKKRRLVRVSWSVVSGPVELHPSLATDTRTLTTN